jgi:hypothetical protein
LTAQGDPHLIANDGGLGKSFEERLSVAGGDMLGFAVEAGDVTGCSVSAIAADRFTDGITPALGVPAPFAPAIPNVRLNLQADLEADADKDGFGDETQDSCPGQGTTHAVCATQIDSGPPNKTKAKKVTFAFSVPGGNAGVDGFECQTDGGSFASCSSPFVVRKLKPGRHAFRVHAVGSRGAGPDATDSFRVTKPKKKKK